jgi:hypothetical protein
MQIPDDEYWCVSRAAMWVATGRPRIRKVQMHGKGDDPYCVASIWLDENKTGLRRHFQGYFRSNAPGMSRSPLDLAIDEIVLAIWRGHLEIYLGEDGQKIERRFRDESELRDWLLDNRFLIRVKAKAVAELWSAWKGGGRAKRRTRSVKGTGG